MKRIMALVLLFLSSCSAPQSPKKIENYKKLMQKEKTVGLDVRSTLEIKLNPSPGSLHISLTDLKEKVSQLDTNTQIFVFCESGGRSSQALKILNAKGYNNVTNIKDWRTWNKINQ